MENALTDIELDLIEGRFRRASPGPWKSFVEGRDHTSGSSFIMVGEGENRQSDIEVSGATPDDQDFIAEARQDVPRLLAEVRALRKRLEALRDKT